MFPKTHASSVARIFFAAVQSFLRLHSFSWHDFPRSKAHAICPDTTWRIRGT